MAAIDELKSILDYYGLGSLTNVLSTRIQDDPTLVSDPMILLNTVRDTPEYKTRFKGNEKRKAAGLPELSPFDYVRMETSFRDTLRANSMPKGFYDTEDDFATFIGNDVAPNELNARIAQGYNAVMQAEPGTKEELKQLYGLQDSDIAAFFIDPARFQQSDAIRKAQAAQIASEARRQAGMGLTAKEAEALATEGIDRGTAQQGFATLGQQAQQDVFGTTFTGEQALTREEQIAGTFGTNAAAAQRVATRKRRRQAEFQTGGGFVTTQTGVTGLGTVGQ